MSQLSKEKILELKKRANFIRQQIVKILGEAGGGHYGGSLSVVEILVALYFHILKVDPQNPLWPDRDRLILSKGHACVALCPILAERGFFPRKLLSTFNKLDSPFGMHPDMHKIPGCDMSTGSLGHGLPVGVGMALAGKMDEKSYRVFVILGDGENDEGSVWEAAMSAAHYKLDNLIAIVDRNRVSLDGPTREIMPLEPLDEKWEKFGWHVQNVDGHKIKEIVASVESHQKGKPNVILAHTVKGKGVSFMEGRFTWHSRVATPEEETQALKELESHRIDYEREKNG